MAVLAVVTSSPPGAEGGHLVLARSLVSAARDAGHDARLVITPDFGFGRLTRSYLANWRIDVEAAAGSRLDQIVSCRYPSYAVRHTVHVCWLNHTMREYYDQWPQFSASISVRNRVKEGTRKRLLHAADWWLLKHNVTRLAAISGTVKRRLADTLGLNAEVVWPPPPQREYRCEAYGDFVLAVSRLTPLKRLDLLIRALAEPVAQGVRAVIAGEGECRSSLERLAMDLGVDGRVRFLGYASDAELLALLARCRVVCFTPHDEDYGFVTVEAFASRKAVVTCHDSGGATELVRDGETGIVCDPTPSSVALALARISDDPALAERLGTAAGERVAQITWPDAVGRLVIV